MGSPVASPGGTKPTVRGPLSHIRRSPSPVVLMREVWSPPFRGSMLRCAQSRRSYVIDSYPLQSSRVAARVVFRDVHTSLRPSPSGNSTTRHTANTQEGRCRGLADGFAQQGTGVNNHQQQMKTIPQNKNKRDPLRAMDNHGIKCGGRRPGTKPQPLKPQRVAAAPAAPVPQPRPCHHPPPPPII